MTTKNKQAVVRYAAACIAVIGTTLAGLLIYNVLAAVPDLLPFREKTIVIALVILAAATCGVVLIAVVNTLLYAWNWMNETRELLRSIASSKHPHPSSPTKPEPSR